MAIIYRKTAKGVEEIRTRSFGLPPRSRSTLIMVDGQRTDEALAALFPSQAAQALAMLLENGFIEVLSTLAGPAVAAVAAPALQTFGALRAAAVRQLIDLVGPAGDTLAMRIERASDLDALRPLLITAQQIVGDLRGPQAARDYIARLSGQ